MDIVTPPIGQYLESLVPERHDVFHAMEREAKETGFPHVGPQVGALLQLLASISQAENVFELGSGFGYSAAWFLCGLPEQGRVVLTDLSAENRSKAITNISRIGREYSIDFLVGDALELLKNSTESWDIIFNDIDKKDYPKVIDVAEGKLKSGGLLVTDNALWYGNVVEKGVDAATDAVREYNQHLANHPGFDMTIIPLRDGVSVARKR
ncbi:O-methyltransferase [bacterium]|nr:O-methyltransferase [bacterium]